MYLELAVRMPELSEGHQAEHKAIEAGLGEFVAYLAAVRDRTRAYDPARLRALMDGLREVLFAHMAHELQSLHAATLQQHWTLDEVRKFPF
jgi:hypothetical protein